MASTKNPRTLRHLVDSCGLSVSAFAAAVGVSRSTVYDWFAGKASPRSYRIAGIADTLQVKEQAVRDALQQAAR